MHTDDILSSSRGLFLILLGVAVLLIAPSVALAQCRQNPTGETAVGLQNDSSYYLTFYIDGENMGGVPAGDRSVDFNVTPGEHMLMAEAVVGGEAVSASRTATIPEGYVCTWTVTDAPPGSKSSAGGAKLSISTAYSDNKARAASGKSGFRDSLSKVKVVTVTGCVREGVECLVLEPFGGGQKYSITRSKDLQVGQAYRITGAVSDISFCQQGFPTLAPRKITRVRMRCR